MALRNYHVIRANKFSDPDAQFSFFFIFLYDLMLYVTNNWLLIIFS